MPLRLGILLPRHEMPRFVASLLETLAASGRVEIVTVRSAGTIDAPSNSFFSTYQFVDRRWSRGEGPLDPVTDWAIDKRTGALPHVDLWLDFAGGALSADARRRARYGSWQTTPAADARTGAFLREALARAPVSVAGVDAITPGGECKAIARLSVATVRGVSQAENRAAFWAVGAALARLVALLEVGGQAWLDVAGLGERANLPLTDSTIPTARFLSTAVPATLTAKMIRRLRLGRKPAHWDLAFRRDGPPLPNARGFDIVPSPSGHFHADPFLMSHEGDPWLFFEDFDLGTERGRLMAARIDARLRLTDTHVVLARPYHLSYPCVFEDAGALFLIPESRANGTVDLYRCATFPAEWTHVRTLATGKFVDTTVCRAHGRYWFFATDVEPTSGAFALCLYSASSIDGDWIAHRKNPISSDIRDARGAGAIFSDGARLIRPSQNCGPGYGYSFSLNEIARLDPDDYDERPLVTVTPDWAPHLAGTHSYARLDDLEVTDVCRFMNPP